MTTIVTTDRTLAQLESIIERGLATFIQVGEALREIREQRLYRDTHQTFELYCRERWGWSKTHANRQIDAAGVAAHLTPIGVKPANESVARVLAPLLEEPEQLRDVWTEAVAQHGAEPTAKQVRDLVADAHRSRQPKRDQAPTAMIRCAESLTNLIEMLEGLCDDPGSLSVPSVDWDDPEHRRAVVHAVGLLRGGHARLGPLISRLNRKAGARHQAEPPEPAA